jgi:hypothetical protein
VVNYKPVSGFPGYRVGDDGTVWTQKSGRWGLSESWRPLKLNLATTGYHYVALSRREPAMVKVFFVHALVLAHFVGPRPPKADCCHANGNPIDNRLQNLRWDTRKANVADAMRHGTFTGSPSRLNPTQTAELVELRSRGWTLRALSRHFGVASISTLSGILKRQRERALTTLEDCGEIAGTV